MLRALSPFGYAPENCPVNAKLDRIVAEQPRFTFTRCADGTLDAVWDHRAPFDSAFTPVGDVVGALFAALGLEAA
jgi:hypothetical protein